MMAWESGNLMKIAFLLYLSWMIIGCSSMRVPLQESPEMDICNKMTYLLNTGGEEPLSILNDRYAPFEIVLTWERADQDTWYLSAIAVKDGKDSFRVENYPPDTISWPKADRCIVRMIPSNVGSRISPYFGIYFSNTDRGFSYMPMKGGLSVDEL